MTRMENTIERFVLAALRVGAGGEGGAGAGEGMGHLGGRWNRAERLERCVINSGF